MKPKYAATYWAGKKILLERGMAGYYEMDTDFDVERFNTDHGVTDKDVLAMTAGSMFGWHVPAANAETH